MSITPLREAIRRLSSEGLVDLDTHRDARVAAIERRRGAPTLRGPALPGPDRRRTGRRSAAPTTTSPRMRAAVARLLPVTRQWGEEALAAHRELPPRPLPGLAQRRADPAARRPVGQVRPLPPPRPGTPAGDEPRTRDLQEHHQTRLTSSSPATPPTPPQLMPRPHPEQPHRRRDQRPRRPRGPSRDVRRGDRRCRGAWGDPIAAEPQIDTAPRPSSRAYGLLRGAVAPDFGKFATRRSVRSRVGGEVAAHGAEESVAGVPCRRRGGRARSPARGCGRGGPARRRRSPRRRPRG